MPKGDVSLNSMWLVHYACDGYNESLNEIEVLQGFHDNYINSVNAGSSRKSLPSSHGHHPYLYENVVLIDYLVHKPVQGQVKSHSPKRETFKVSLVNGRHHELSADETLCAIEEAMLVPGKRVTASYNGEWLPGTLKKVSYRRKRPYGVQCDQDKKNVLTWVKRGELRMFSSANPP